MSVPTTEAVAPAIASPVTSTFAPPAGSPPSAANPTSTPTTITPHANPKVNELQAMFPTVEVSVIELVLETSGGSTDRSIEQLLSMTDDNFKPDELESVRREEASQVDLDEEFARSLVMQDEQHQQNRSTHRLQPGVQQQQAGFIPPADQLPYQARVRKARPANQGQDGQWEPPARDEQRRASGTENPPGMLAVEDKINRFAETAGQTFNTFLGRAKAKYSEFQQQQQQRQAENAGINARESNWGQEPAQQSYRGQEQQWSAPGGGRGGQGGRSAHGWGETSSYDSRSDGYSVSDSFTSESTTGAPPPTQAKPVARPSPGRWQPGDTYDDPAPPQRSMSGNQVGGRRSPGVGSPEKHTTGKIDPAKLGILPKKRVDLLSTSPSSAPMVPPKTTSRTAEEDFNPGLTNASSDLVNKIPATPPASKDPKSPYRLEDSDDELEYTKSPFEGR